MDALIHQQSPDIAGAVACSKEKRAGLPVNQDGFDAGAGDQGVMIGYACNETPQLLSLPVVLATGSSGNYQPAEEADTSMEYCRTAKHRSPWSTRRGTQPV